ncbi:MAG: polysaccharide biosynthesis protein, partial [Actinobacteria bacterium]|nr:polysaccharide biosynthesis protein [Actinomycetota bacterium]
MDYENKTVLITGGTGSFGNAMVDHLRGRAYREIRIFSRDEAKQDAMRRRVTAD